MMRMRAMAAPTVSHLDPLMLALLDDVCGRLGRLFRAVDGSFAFAMSGTGTSGMETVVANLVREGSRSWSSSPDISAIASRRCASAMVRR